MSPNPVHRRLFALLSFCTLAAASCGGDGGYGGTLVISAAGDADALFPPTVRSQQAQQVVELLFDKLADIPDNLSTIGDSGWTPRLAERWEWSRDSMAVTFHLNPKARWHDSVPVRAADVLFAYSVYTDPVVAVSDGAQIRGVVDSLTASDSLTFTVWYGRRSAERFYAVAYNLFPLPEHLLGKVPRDSLRTSGFTRQPVGNGPYRLVIWDRGQRLELAAVDGYYRGRANLDRVIWSIVSDGQTATERVFTGEADFIFRLSSADAAAVSKHPDVRSEHLGGTAYAFVVFNAREGANTRPHPILGDRGVRRALTMAVDRKSLVANLLDSLGRVALGPFARAQWSADTTLRQLPFDRAAAARTLDSLGWRLGRDGIRARDGRLLEFSLLLPGSSPDRQRLGVMLQEQWRQIGVRVKVETVDFSAYGARTLSGNFDAALSQVAPSPSPNGLRQGWSTAAITMSNGMNLARYSDAVVDAQIDSAVNATSLASGRAHYRTAYQTLIDNAPALWIYEPVIVAGINRRVTTGPMRKDAWWLSIPSWRVSGKSPGRDSASRGP